MNNPLHVNRINFSKTKRLEKWHRFTFWKSKIFAELQRAGCFDVPPHCCTISSHVTLGTPVYTPEQMNEKGKWHLTVITKHHFHLVDPWKGLRNCTTGPRPHLEPLLSAIRILVRHWTPSQFSLTFHMTRLCLPGWLFVHFFRNSSRTGTII